MKHPFYLVAFLCFYTPISIFANSDCQGRSPVFDKKMTQVAREILRQKDEILGLNGTEERHGRPACKTPPNLRGKIIKQIKNLEMIGADSIRLNNVRWPSVDYLVIGGGKLLAVTDLYGCEDVGTINSPYENIVTSFQKFTHDDIEKDMCNSGPSYNVCLFETCDKITLAKAGRPFVLSQYNNPTDPTVSSIEITDVTVAAIRDAVSAGILLNKPIVTGSPESPRKAFISAGKNIKLFIERSDKQNPFTKSDLQDIGKIIRENKLLLKNGSNTMRIDSSAILK